MNGGVIESLGVSSGSGSGELFVIEADESDKSFLLYDTAVALVTNVDPEHLDFYGSREAFMQAFADFALGARELLPVISADDPGTREVLTALAAVADGHTRPAIRTSGEREDADVRIVAIDDSGPVKFTVEVDGERYSSQLAVYGRHNAVNAVGALAVLTGLGYEPERRSKRFRSSAARSVASSFMPRSAACASTTTTLTTRPRWRLCSTRRAPWSAKGGLSRFISRISSAEPRCFTVSSPRCSSRVPIIRSCSRSTVLARIPLPV